MAAVAIIRIPDRGRRNKLEGKLFGKTCKTTRSYLALAALGEQSAVSPVALPSSVEPIDSNNDYVKLKRDQSDKERAFVSPVVIVHNLNLRCFADITLVKNVLVLP